MMGKDLKVQELLYRPAARSPGLWTFICELLANLIRNEEHVRNKWMI